MTNPTLTATPGKSPEETKISASTANSTEGPVKSTEENSEKLTRENSVTSTSENGTDSRGKNTDGQTSESKEPWRNRVFPTETDDYGYDFFPKRLENPNKSMLRKWWDISWDNRHRAQVVRCQARVAWCVNNDPTVKLMIRALKSKGCEVDYKRHIVCEPCRYGVNGGWDSQTKQVVVCHNNSQNQGICCSVLGHELLHAFDYCRAKVDFQNMEHLACTEIRAANTQHCTFMAAVTTGDASFFNIKGRQQECVKTKALQSVMMVRNTSVEEAKKVVESVFTRCYNDLEPMGCVPRKHTMDRPRALYEGLDYGYVP